VLLEVAALGILRAVLEAVERALDLLWGRRLGGRGPVAVGDVVHVVVVRALLLRREALDFDALVGLCERAQKQTDKERNQRAAHVLEKDGLRWRFCVFFLSGFQIACELLSVIQ